MIKKQQHSDNSPFGIKLPRNRTLKAKDVLRIHSQLISQFIAGNINNHEAKTLAYLCSSYLAVYNTVEIEERLKKLEDLSK